MNHGVQGGLALFVLGLLGALVVWHTRSRFRTRGRNSSATVRGLANVHVATGDVDGDGKAGISVGDVNQDGRPDDLKISENESPWPKTRNFINKNSLTLDITSLLVAAAGMYIAGASGGVWKNKTFTAVIVPTDSRDTTKTTTPTPTPTVAKTCKDKGTLATGYKLFYNDTYKYCIPYKSDWAVDSKDPAMVTIGTVNDAPTWGWLKASYLSDKTVAQRTELLMSNYREPAGPRTTTNVTVSGQAAKKLDCIDAREGAHHIYVLLGHGKDLFEFSYIEGMGEDKATADSIYKIIFDNILIGDYQ